MDAVLTEQRAAQRSPLTSWLGVVSVTAGLFSLVTTEILPIGLLTSIGADFTVSDGMAGLMMTMPGFLAAVAAPLVTAATGRVDRRRMLGAFMLLLALANFVAATADAYGWILASRAAVGVTIGGFWSLGAGLAPRLVPAAAVGRATALIFAAVPLGSVLGVPLGTFVGDVAGWRTAFAAMGVLSLAVCAALWTVLPPLPPEQVTRLRTLGRQLGCGGTRFALLVTFLVVLAHFGTYTYVTPFLEQVTGAGPAVITVALLTYGAAGMLGNFVGGTAAARRPHGTFAAAAALIAGATLLLPVLGRTGAGAFVLLVAWGVGYGAVPVCSQTLFAKAAPETGAVEASSTLFTASFQATISTGALAGGALLDRSSPSVVLAVGGAVALAVVPVVGRRRGTAAT
ncbi:MFS transporter [Streptomyces oryzae]|uniref:MFS transporter n=1 Tax=Streptomyces oryzae TaxID=1434886 RepID=A0ABS3XMR4_9ACTN|nr:MFS transporter [Streptomyces oryzae]MBO8196698.1 MFS transporter [Streptomyces oryzae]